MPRHKPAAHHSHGKMKPTVKRQTPHHNGKHSTKGGGMAKRSPAAPKPSKGGHGKGTRLLGVKI